MKLKDFVCGCLLAFPALLSAQNVSYSLPMTTVTVEVEAVQENFYAGPYASFAKQLLGLEVAQSNHVRNYVRGVRILTRVEADPTARYSVDFKSAETHFLVLSSQGLVSFRDKAEAGDLVWRFDPQAVTDFSTQGLTAPTRSEVRVRWEEVKTDTAVIRVPVQESVEVAKTQEMKAREAAEMVLKARKERFNIATGNTDATFSGEALGAALKELDRVEKEYLSLFTGYTVNRSQTGSFDVVPAPSAGKQKYVAFRLTDTGVLAGPSVSGGLPYYLEFTPVGVADAETSNSKSALHYRIPAVCTVTLSEGTAAPMVTTRIPVYQLGTEGTMSLK